eukprot:COSAG02_NODE_11597_length_1691_cov_18.883166_1_plen_54_part_00
MQLLSTYGRRHRSSFSDALENAYSIYNLEHLRWLMPIESKSSGGKSGQTITGL